VIRAHRVRHLRIWLALAILLPALLVAALLARAASPSNDALPKGAPTFSEPETAR